MKQTGVTVTLFSLVMQILNKKVPKKEGKTTKLPTLVSSFFILRISELVWGGKKEKRKTYPHSSLSPPFQ